MSTLRNKVLYKILACEILVECVGFFDASLWSKVKWVFSCLAEMAD